MGEETKQERQVNVSITSAKKKNIKFKGSQEYMVRVNQGEEIGLSPDQGKGRRAGYSQLVSFRPSSAIYSEPFSGNLQSQYLSAKDGGFPLAIFYIQA